VPSTPCTPKVLQLNENSDEIGLTHIPKNILLAVNQFRRKQKKGCIDVWWLYDDGGLTLLLPYLLTTRKQWSDCKLRVFALANNENELDSEKRNMASLLSKFRIDYSNVTIIPDLVKPPKESSLQFFDQIIAKWIIKDSDNKTGLNNNINNNNNNNNNNNEKSNSMFGVTETEILALKEKVISTQKKFLKFIINLHIFLDQSSHKTTRTSLSVFKRCEPYSYVSYEKFLNLSFLKAKRLVLKVNLNLLLGHFQCLDREHVLHQCIWRGLKY